MNTNSVCTISVLDSLYILHGAWASVTPKTILNCFHHAGFGQQVQSEDSSDNEADDDIPLVRLKRLVSGSSIDVDINLMTSEVATDDSILADIVSKKSASTDSSNEEEPASTPKKKITMEEAMDVCDMLTAFVSTFEGSDNTMTIELTSL